MALYELRRSARYEVVALLTTVAGEFDRVSHHGVRVELLEQQAAAVGVALHKLYLPPDRCTNEEYAALWKARCANTARRASGRSPSGTSSWRISAPIASGTWRGSACKA